MQKEGDVETGDNAGVSIARSEVLVVREGKTLALSAVPVAESEIPVSEKPHLIFTKILLEPYLLFFE